MIESPFSLFEAYVGAKFTKTPDFRIVFVQTPIYSTDLYTSIAVPVSFINISFGIMAILQVI